MLNKDDSPGKTSIANLRRTSEKNVVMKANYNDMDETAGEHMRKHALNTRRSLSRSSHHSRRGANVWVFSDVNALFYAFPSKQGTSSHC